MKRFVFFAVLIAAFGAASILNGQQSSSEDKSLEETLKNLSKDAASAYVAPVVSGIGADLNSGWFHRAPRATMFGFDLEFGVVAMGTFFKDEQKAFSADGIFRFDSSQSYKLTEFIKTDPQFIPYNNQQRADLQQEVMKQLRGLNFSVGIFGPTILGKTEDTVKIAFKGNTFRVTDPNSGFQRDVNVPSRSIGLADSSFGHIGGIDNEDIKEVFPLVAPQLTIGTFLGSQFTFRYLPSYDVENFGKLKYFGFGVQHNPGIWFGDILPLEISASFFTQTFEAGSLFKATATAFGVNASKRLGWGFLNLTPYAGFMVESSSMKFNYEFIVDQFPQKIEFELKGENKTRITAGVSIKVLVVNINADYNWSKYNSASIGLMFII